MSGQRTANGKSSGMIARNAVLRVGMVVRHKDYPALTEYLASIERGEMNRTLARLLSAAIEAGLDGSVANNGMQVKALAARVDRLEGALLRLAADSLEQIPAAPMPTAPTRQERRPKPAASASASSESPAPARAPATGVALDALAATAPQADAGQMGAEPSELTPEQIAAMHRMASAFDASPEGVDSP